MDYHEHILRLLAELLLLALQHPIWAAAWACALVVLRYLAGGIGSATVSYLWTEYVLKRVLPRPRPPRRSSGKGASRPSLATSGGRRPRGTPPAKTH